MVFKLKIDYSFYIQKSTAKLICIYIRYCITGKDNFKHKWHAASSEMRCTSICLAYSSPLKKLPCAFPCVSLEIVSVTLIC